MAEPNARSIEEIRELLRELEQDSADNRWALPDAAGEKAPPHLPTLSLPPADRPMDAVLPKIVEEHRKEKSAAVLSAPAVVTKPSGSGRRGAGRLLLAFSLGVAAAAASGVFFVIDRFPGEPETSVRLQQGPQPAVRAQATATAPTAPTPPETVRAETAPVQLAAVPAQTSATPAQTSAPPAQPADPPAAAKPAPTTSLPPESPLDSPGPGQTTVAEQPEPAAVQPVTAAAPASSVVPEPSGRSPASRPEVSQQQPRRNLPPRIVSDGLAAPAGQKTRVRLAFEPTHEAANHVVLVTGLEASAVLNKGVELIQGTWLLRADELDDLEIRREPDAPGRLVLGLELRTKAGSVVGESSVVLTAPAAAQPPVERPAPEPPVRSTEAGRLLAEARALISRGDLVNARMFLQQATELGSAQAALELADTYSRSRTRPEVVQPAREDREMALTWYERAAALGSEEARRRIAGMKPN